MEGTKGNGQRSSCCKYGVDDDVATVPSESSLWPELLKQLSFLLEEALHEKAQKQHVGRKN